ncbi:MAG TPA: hypothetical protein VGF73_08985, partial [Chthoniobacterales bacterium]
MTQDEEHLRLLGIFHYVVGGLAALFSLFPLIYAAAGFLFLHAPPAAQQKGGPPPAIVGYFFIGFGLTFFSLGIAFAICLAISGCSIARRRRYWFVFVMACIECLFIPFGVILGVFTLIILVRDSVKPLFG